MNQYQTKKEMIYSILKKEILTGELALGEKVVISHMAKRFESSEIPVREAMNKLSSENLIEVKPHVGAIVTPLSLEELRQILELRIVLECYATKVAAKNLDSQDFNELNFNIQSSKTAYEESDYNKFAELNHNFHMIIYSKSNNDLLIKTIQDLWDNSKRYPSLFEQNNEHITKSLLEHESIYNSLKEKNINMAEKLMYQHKKRASDGILKITKEKTKHTK